MGTRRKAGIVVVVTAAGEDYNNEQTNILESSSAAFAYLIFIYGGAAGCPFLKSGTTRRLLCAISGMFSCRVRLAVVPAYVDRLKSPEPETKKTARARDSRPIPR